MNNVKSYFQKPEVDYARECIDLHELSEEENTKKLYHTMSKKLFGYVNTKFSPEQKEILNWALSEKISVEVHGVPEKLIPFMLRERNAKTVLFPNGKRKIERPHENNTKEFNKRRPFFILTECCEYNTDGGSKTVLMLITFPSEEYTRQFSELIFAYYKLNLQQVTQPANFSAVIEQEENVKTREKLKRIYKAQIDYSVEQCAVLLAHLKSKQISVKSYFYPAFIDRFAEWTGLDFLSKNMGMVKEGDIAVIGYVDQLRAILVAKGFTSLFDGKFLNFGLNDCYGFQVLLSPNQRKRIVLLGFRHSYWGKPAGKICYELAKAGAREIIYFAKAGSLQSKSNADDTGYLKVIHNKYMAWAGKSDSPRGYIHHRTEETELKSQLTELLSKIPNAIKSDYHVSVPTVVGEDSFQIDTIEEDGHPQSIDNEISYIASDLNTFRKQHSDANVKFTCAHFITDFVTTRTTAGLSGLPGLDGDSEERKSAFFQEVSSVIREFVQTNGAIHTTDDIDYESVSPIFNPGNVFLHLHPAGKTIQKGKHKILSGQIALPEIIEIIDSTCLNGNQVNYRGTIESLNEYGRIVVSGEAGSGKSVLAEATFIYLNDLSNRNHIPKTPVYINFSDYEKRVFDEYATPEEAVDDIIQKLKIFDATYGPLVLIFDGLDKFSLLNESLCEKILRAEPFQSASYIYFSRRYRSIHTDPKENPKVMGQNLHCDHSFVIGHDGSPQYDESWYRSTLPKILALLSATPLQGVKIAIEKRLSDWPEFSVNLRLLHLLLEREDKDYSDPSSFLRTFLNEYFKDNLSAIKLSLATRICSEIAFELMIERNESPEAPTNQVQNLARRITTQSLEMMSYLAAYHLDQKIFELNDYDVERVFTHLINKHSKNLISIRDPESSFKRIEALLKTNQNIRFRGFLTYLVGRIPAKDGTIIRQKCMDLLRKELVNLAKNSAHDAESLIYERSLHISLAYLGDDAEIYVKNLVNNPIADRINRGFHLTYYGDDGYWSSQKHEDGSQNSEDMMGPDDCSTPFLNTKKALLRNVKNPTSGPAKLNIATYTLFSLAFARYPQKKYKTDFKLLSGLVTYLIEERGSELFDEVKEYIQICKYYFDSFPKSPDKVMLHNALRLKRWERSGWNWKKRTVKNPESVQSHVGFAAYIATAYLPEEADQENWPDIEVQHYNKYKILKAILYHDVSEWLKGDIPKHDKDGKERREERFAAKYFQILSRNREMQKYRFDGDFYELWSKVEDCSENSDINIKIAKDIDRLECLLQLEAYVEEENTSIPDYEEFRRGLIRSFRTTQVKEIFNLLKR